MVALKKFRLSWLEWLILGFLIGFNLISRFWELDQLPAIIPHDEMVYAVQAKSYSLQAMDLTQTHRPWYLKPFDGMYAELPATLMSLGFVLFDQPLLAAHFTSALMGCTLPFLVAWLTYLIWQNKRVSLSVLIILTFNPTFWQMSRLGYDVWYSLWLYVLGGCLILQPKLVWKIMSFVIFFIGFFNYQGFKLLLLPWLVLLLALKITLYIDEKNHKNKFSLVTLATKIFRKEKWLLAGVTFGFLLTLFYGLVLAPKNQVVSTRLNNTIFSDFRSFEQAVNTNRRQTLQSRLTPLVYNKATEKLNFVLNRLLGVFDPHLLFMLVEPAVSGFSVWTHGLFYWLEGGLMIVGMLFIASQPKIRLSVMPIILGIGAMAMPALINTGSEWYLLRGMLSYLLLAILAGWGLALVTRYKWVRESILLIYILSVANFAFQYFYRYPIISLDWGNYYERVIARYVNLVRLQNPGTHIVVYVSQPDYYFWSFLLYSGEIRQDTAEQIKVSSVMAKNVGNKEFNYQNIAFVSDCDSRVTADVIIGEASYKECLAKKYGQNQTKSKVLSIPAALDSGEKLAIINDQLCGGYYLRSYVQPRFLSDLEVEKMGEKQFCETWVTNQNLTDYQL